MSGLVQFSGVLFIDFASTYANCKITAESSTHFSACAGRDIANRTDAKWTASNGVKAPGRVSQGRI